MAKAFASDEERRAYYRVYNKQYRADRKRGIKRRKPKEETLPPYGVPPEFILFLRYLMR